MRADPAEFRRLDLRCHGLLRDVPLHDVWTITLTGGGPGRTMQDVVAVSPFRTVSRLTGVYMTLIDPFRRVIVYPALIRAMQRAWSAAYA